MTIVLLPRPQFHVELSPLTIHGLEEFESCRRGGMADAEDLKSSGGNPVWVRFPPPVLFVSVSYGPRTRNSRRLCSSVAACFFPNRSRHHLSLPPVSGLVDNPHAAAADFAEDFIAFGMNRHARMARFERAA